MLAPLGVLAAGPAAAAPVDNAAAAVSTATTGSYTAVTPVRICDSRPKGTGIAVNQCNGTNGVGAPLGPGATKSVHVAGTGLPVPVGATAAVLNVTVTDTTAPSFLTVWPAGLVRPTASNINWVAGQTVPNLVQVQLGLGGDVSVFNQLGSTNVIVDLEGYVDTSVSSLFNPLPPVRICDTRSNASGSGINPCQGANNVDNKLTAGGQLAVKVADSGTDNPRGIADGVPAGATAVVLNVTVTNTTAASFLTVWPDGATQPLASNLNWVAGETVPNRVIVPLPPASGGNNGNGKIDVINAVGSADVIVDVNGYYGDGGSAYTPNTPARVCDTRPAGTTVLANICNDPSHGGLGATTEFALTAPTGTSAVVYNVTIADSTAPTFLTVFPDPGNQGIAPTPPVISDLNSVPGQVVANLVVVAAGTSERIFFYNDSGKTDITVDQEGVYIPQGS